MKHINTGEIQSTFMGAQQAQAIAVIYLELRFLVGLVSYWAWRSVERRFSHLSFFSLALVIGAVASDAFFVNLFRQAAWEFLGFALICICVGTPFHRWFERASKKGDAFALLWLSSMTSYSLGGRLLFVWLPLPHPILTRPFALVLLALALGTTMLATFLGWFLHHRPALPSGEEAPLARP